MRKKIFYFLLLGSVALASCQKNIDEFVPDPTVGSDTWYNNLNSTMPVADLKTNLLLPVQQDSVDISNGMGSFATTSGMQCNFFIGSIIDAANVPITGKIAIETHLLKSKGDMIRMGTPTTSDGRLLISGGELFVRLTKDGNELNISQYGKYYITFSDPAPSPLMKFFVGDQTNPAVFNWLPVNDTLNRVDALSQSYTVVTNYLNWINCDYFYDTSAAPRTIVSAGLPANYTNANTIAFTVFNDMRSVIGMYGNATTRKFSTGKIPVNKQITLVVISKQGNDYYLGHTQAQTESQGQAGSIESQVVDVVPVLTSFDNIKTYLNSL